MFGGKLHKGKHDKPISAGTVQTGLDGVITMIALETGEQPFHQWDGTHYIKPIQHMLVGFKNFDPAVEKNLACHPDLAAFACAWGLREDATVQQRAVGDLS